jgi:DNA-binding NarL/FixJ family response regulator
LSETNIPIKKLNLILRDFSSCYRLTQRESEILSLLASYGYTNREIAEHCCISEKTVKIHLANIMNKIGISSMRRLFSMFFQQVFQAPERTNEFEKVASIGMS